jgi:hypothetical protein
MSAVAAPGWARLTDPDLGSDGGPSRGVEKAEKRKISCRAGGTEGFAGLAKTFRKPAYGGYAMSCQIEGRSVGSNRMSQGLIWLYAVAQGLGVLALNVALRVLVS